MLERTDIIGIRNTVKSFIYLDPEPIEECPFLVSHPIFDSNVMTFRDDDKVYELLNPEDLSYVQNEFKKRVNNYDLLGCYMLVRTPYKLTFIKYAMDYMSLEDFSHLLADAWVAEENPNQDVNCSIPFIIKLFRKSDKSILMTQEDYEVYKNLPESIRVYRGVAVGRNPKGLSWTNNLEKARWFSNRFNNKNEVGYIQTVIVNKKDILAYFNTRNEDELVCDIRKYKINRLEE